jgi:hypothetical protein
MSVEILERKNFGFLHLTPCSVICLLQFRRNVLFPCSGKTNKMSGGMVLGFRNRDDRGRSPDQSVGVRGQRNNMWPLKVSTRTQASPRVFYHSSLLSDRSGPSLSLYPYQLSTFGLSFYPEDKGSALFLNVGKHLLDYASQNTQQVL